MNRKYFLPLTVLSIFFLAIVAISLSKTSTTKTNLGSSMTVFSEMKEDQLYKEIEEYNGIHEILPIDAKLDPIWKAIPGYNGLSVDLEASYNKMKTSGKFDETKIVFTEVSPKIHLDDLEPSPIYRGNLEKPMIALLINVAWGDEHIPGILKTLNESSVKATFFFDGSWVKKTPHLASMIYLEGHEIGNHAYSHPDLKLRTPDETRMELQKTNDVIQEALELTPKWFAPPSGSFNQTTINVANELKMKTILWTVDTVDWRKPSTNEMVQRVVAAVENGSMILMHPTKPTEEGLETMIDEIQNKGFQLGTVSDLMSEKRLENKNP
ncbi:polysaccharide deacetylase family protein [Sporosarcina siberiensis]|uniref:Polysaccharide deacetylase family protein n=1 Tax=Sporosarcina siberiensis TaxID=1365606 RepID=A0ABW4SIT0_9BACL